MTANLIETLHATPGVHGIARSADGRMTQFRRRGVIDLFTLVTTDPDFLRGGQLADAIIGRGAALLAVKGGVSEIHADLLSMPAKEVLDGAGVSYTYGELVPNIINWEGTGPCLVEALTSHVSDPDQAISLIRQFFIGRGMIQP